MKRFLLNLFAAFSFFSAQAQIEDGSIAPDFTVTDVLGVTHTLSDYLAEGKTVIMDISATWCGPCWGYHNSGELEGLYYSLGQGGTGEVVVLFVEGDGQTSVDCLFGNCTTGSTWGNWVETPYPVIDSALIGQLYQVAYFPTVFRICPDGTVSAIGALDTEALVANIAANCGTGLGMERNAHPHLQKVLACNGSAATPRVTITNYGSQPITTATLTILHEGTVLATQDFNVSIDPLKEGMVIFNPLDLAVADNYTIEITAINGQLPQNTATATSEFEVMEAPVSGTAITVKVKTDYYPATISWAIKNSDGNIVATGGPYQPGNEGDFGAGGPDADTTIVHEITLPENTQECYTVEMYDSIGFGWSTGGSGTGMEIWSGDEKIFDKPGNEFEYEFISQPVFKTEGELGSPMQDESAFLLYPNPTKGVLNFTGTEKAAVTITDTTGKTVYTASGIENGSTINLSALQKGIYVAMIESGSTTVTQKIVLN
jgi:archaellum component FlaF (FlaF/FlaG flagellin family)